MIAIIEKVYQFLWGDWIVLPLPGGSSFQVFTARTDIDSGRNLVYDPDEISSHPSVSGHAAYIV